MHEIKLHPYKADVGGFQSLKLGTKDSYGIEQLHIVPGAAWNGLVISATFVTQQGRIRMVVPDNGIIDVPHEATMFASGGEIVFAGVKDGVQRITVDLPYTIDDHSPIDGTDPAPTPSEWEQFVSQVKDDADRAEKAAGEAESALDELSGQAERAEAAADRAAQSETNAAASATAAAGSAADAAAELAKVQGAGTAALTSIGNAQTTAVGEVQTAQTTATQAVEQAGAAQTGAVNTAGQAQQTDIQQAGTAQVDAVNAAGDAKLAEINAANALLPTPTEADAGKAPIAQPDGTYALEAVTVDAYTKAEADARYAPIEAAIKVSSKGTGLASLSPTVPWKLQGLKIYGRSWQDGTPSVETEVPIQNAGDSGSIDVTVCGVNLFDLSYVNANVITKHNVLLLEYSDGLSFEVTGDDAYVGNSISAGTTAGTGSLQLAFKAAPNKKYSISLSDTSLIKNYVSFLDRNNVSLSSSSFTTTSYSVLTPEGCVKVALRIGTGNAPVGTRVDTTIMANVGDTAQPYQPYTAQQLPIPTTDGLPGIPVDSGGNWTDENGQQWVSDVVDLAEGTKTQFDAFQTITGDSTVSNIDASLPQTTRFVVALKTPAKNSGFNSRCSHAEKKIMWVADEVGFYVDLKNAIFRFPKSVIGESEESIKAWLGEQNSNGTPLRILYQLKTPITTPLDSDTIAAYKALQSYDGTTNVLAPDCGIEVAAVAEPAQYIEDRIQAAITKAVTQAVAITGGNT